MRAYGSSLECQKSATRLNTVCRCSLLLCGGGFGRIFARSKHST